MKVSGRLLSDIIVVLLLTLSVSPSIAGSTDEGTPEDELIFFQGPDSPPHTLRTRWGSFHGEEIYDTVPVNGNEHNADIWIVQFDGPIDTMDRRSLEREGFRILEYLPDFAYVTDISGADPSSAMEIEGVSFVGPFPSGLMMSPETYHSLEGGGDLLSLVDETRLVVDTFVPVNGIETELGEISPVVVKGSETRYLIGPSISDRDEIMDLEAVSNVEPYYTVELHNNVSKDIISVQEAWDTLGLDGTGQIVAISDTGLDNGTDNHSIDGDIHHDFDNRATIVNWAGTSADDGHSHGTHVAGSVAGDGSRSNGSIKGMAPNASIFFQAIMTDSGGLSIPSNTSLLFKQAYDNGSRIHTNSWGSSVDGLYTTRSRDVDWFLYNNPDMIILYSAGNSGIDWSPEDGRVDHDSIGAPATAKNALTVGASENHRLDGGYDYKWGDWGAYRYINGSWVVYPKYPVDPVYSDKLSDNASGMAAFSSVGPTDDGRIKPDVVAPGTNILSCRSQVTGAGTGWGVFDEHYVFMGGTSMSTPITAGSTVLVREFYNRTLGMDSPSGALMKATLINGAMDMTPGQYGPGNSTVQEIQGRPDMHQGWGRINITESLSPNNGNLAFMDDRKGMGTGDEIVSYLDVTSSSKELRITMAYSDYPGALYASTELVNDLDITLTAPNGTEYRGNDWSAPFNDTADRVNPVEGVTVGSPSTGTWKVTVSAYNVPMGPQHFAVVASGAVSNFSGVVSIDGDYFSTQGDEVPIRVIDQDLVGSGSVRVRITSDSDTTGINVTLTESGRSGLFEGYVVTRNSSGSNSSRITTADNDNITVSYTDTDPSGVFNSTAVAKDPVRVHLVYRPEFRLIQSEGERIHMEGRIDGNATSYWMLEGSGLDRRLLHDDGNSTFGDGEALDLNVSDIWFVPPNTTGNFKVRTMVEDPYLGNRTYDHFPMRFNTSLPRYPGNVSVDVDPRGNSVSVRWDSSNETDLLRYNIYLNSSGSATAPAGWSLLGSTSPSVTHYNVTDLVDGVEYSFGVSTEDTNGNESSLSIPANATPQDTVPPDVTMLNTPETIVGEVRFMFSGSADLEHVEVEFYNDTNSNGLLDDGDWQKAVNGTPPAVVWNTTLDSGGPGFVDSMFLRYRGTDEANNTSNWTLVENFRVDNIGPSSVEILSPPPVVTNTDSFLLSGRSEADGQVEIWLNGNMMSVSQCNGLGGFQFWMNLTEGYNELELRSFDQFGAGPTNRTYPFTLDTMEPNASVNGLKDTGITMDISKEPYPFNSTSRDRGVDPDHRYIENLTWMVTDPLDDTRTIYGSEMVDLLFSELGSYTIILTVRDPATNSNTTYLNIEVIDDTGPSVRIEGPTTVDERETVGYEHNVSDNDPFWFRRTEQPVLWQFRGEDFIMNSTEMTAYVSFPLPGLYTVNLTVTDGGSNTMTVERVITVLDTTPPEGNIEGHSPVTLGEVSTFTPNVTDNDADFPAGADFGWNLTYLEGSIRDRWSEFGTGEVFSYNFTVSGSYMLTLTVTDAAGNERDIQKPIYTVGDITPPSIVEVVPAENLTHQYPEDMTVTLIFNEEVDPDTVNSTSIDLRSVGGESIDLQIRKSGPAEIRIIPPTLEFGETYTLTVGRGITDTWGNHLGSVMSINYTIRTLFSLDFPEGVIPSSPDENFTGNDDSIYNITLRFSNPVAHSSIMNGLTVRSIKTEYLAGGEREVRREVSFFVVNEGDDPYTAMVSIQLDRGTRYNITLDTNVRDIYDYRLDRIYQWEVETYIPPDIDRPQEEDGDEEDIPQWLLDPILWIIAAAVLVVLFLVLFLFARIRRKRKLDRIWDSDRGQVERNLYEQEEKEETDSSTDMPDEDEEVSSPPSYDDLYSDIGTAPEESGITDPSEEYRSSMFQESGPVDWDEDKEDDEMDWDDAEEYDEDIEEFEDLEEESEEFHEDDEELDWE